ncbi:hypothetical protein AB0K35_28085 [Micromonospora sp. NPDC053740]|uniref:hypothetical protein n=1 Tax=Micromonospora sp. NPDC053740 TaxID=3155173 RepID=UPI0034349AE4
MQHATLVANTVTTLTFTTNGAKVEVLNVDGAAEVYFRTDGANPTVGGANCHPLPAAVNSCEAADESTGDTVVRLISAGTPRVSVRVW